jgi:hypothetical protein
MGRHTNFEYRFQAQQIFKFIDRKETRHGLGLIPWDPDANNELLKESKITKNF